MDIVKSMFCSGKYIAMDFDERRKVGHADY